MSHKHKIKSHFRQKTRSRELQQHREEEMSARSSGPKLEVVLKCDSAGSVEAVTASVLSKSVPGVDIFIIYSGIGDINKSDIIMAETGSRLVVGFQVDVLPGTEANLKEQSVDVRLYNVIYSLTDDIKKIAQSMIPRVAQEEITGSAKIIALFKSSRKGIIIGCEVLKGYLAHGHHFRIISAVGPVYAGIIESIHREKDAVQKATPGQQVGIKIRDFTKAKIGDFVESFRPSHPKKLSPWQPTGLIMRKYR